MIDAKDLNDQILEYCKIRNISGEQFLKFLGEVLSENKDKPNIEMSEIVRLMDEKIKNTGEAK